MREDFEQKYMNTTLNTLKLKSVFNSMKMLLDKSLIIKNQLSLLVLIQGLILEMIFVVFLKLKNQIIRALS